MKQNWHRGNKHFRLLAEKKEFFSLGAMITTHTGNINRMYTANISFIYWRLAAVLWIGNNPNLKD